MSELPLGILCIEDDPDVREIICMALELSAQVRVRSCGSGAEALAIAAASPPELILLDVMMPGLDGTETLRRLRADARTAAIPVVFITAKATSNDLQRLSKLGARGVICKPFDPLTLLEQVRAFVTSPNAHATP